MRKKALNKDFRMEVRKSLNRFLSILLIVALGVAFYAGIQSSAPDMRVTEDAYFDDSNLMDIRVISTLGLTDEDLTEIGQVEGVLAVEGSYSEDVYCGDEESLSVLRVESFSGMMNEVALSAGTFPDTADECFLDESYAADMGYEVGDTLSFTVADEDDSSLKEREYTIAGIGYSPCYIAFTRGSTTLGTGSLAGFVYVLPEAFDAQAYSAAYVQVEGAKEETAYTDAYDDLVEEVRVNIEDISDVRAEARYTEVIDDAEAELSDARQEVEDGKADLADAEAELADAKAEAESELNEAESELLEGEEALKDGKAELSDAIAEAEEAQSEFDEGYAEFLDGEAEINDAARQLREAKETLDEGEESYHDGMMEYLTTSLSGLKELKLVSARLESGREELAEGWAEYNAGLSEAAAGEEELASARQQLYAGQAEYESGLSSFNEGVSEYDASVQTAGEGRAALDAAKEELAEGESEYQAGRAALDAAWQEYYAGQAQVEAGQADYDAASAEVEQLRSYAAAAQAAADNMAAAVSLAEANLAAAQSEYTAALAALESLTSEDEGYDAAQQLVDEKAQAVSGAQAELDSAKSGQERAQAGADELSSQLSTAEAALSEAESELAAGQAKLSAALSELNANEAALSEARAQLDAGADEIAANEKVLEEGEAALSKAGDEIESGRAELNAAAAEISSGWGEVAEGEASLQEGYVSLSEALIELNEAEEQILDGERQVDEAYFELYFGGMALAEARAELDEGWEEFYSSADEFVSGWQELDDARHEIEEGRPQLQSAWAAIADAQKEIEINEKKLEEGWEEYYDGKAEADQEIADAQKEIEDGRKEIEDAEQEIADAEEAIREIDYPTWYVYDRSSLPDNTGYGENADRMTSIATVFPVIFFLIAALISLTTMTRMVEEERTQIGTMKALGYSRYDIAKKYLKYAFWATIAGSVIGFLFGEKVFPWVIIEAYGIMYAYMPVILLPYNFSYGLIATGISLVCTIGATLAACLGELKEVPAELMRPPTPKQGKRVFLERVPLIWNRLNFNWKSTVRNLMRYMSRALMMIFGIGGCMGLILVGYGIRDSIMDVVVLQYDELQTYDAMLILDTDASKEEWEEVETTLNNNPDVTNWGYYYMQSYDIAGRDASGTGKQWTIYVYVPEEPENAGDLLTFRSRTKKGETYDFSDEGAVITEKITQEFDLSVGDTITLTKDNGDTVSVPISAVCENYLQHYLYLTPALYEEVFGEAPEYNGILFNTDEDQAGIEKIGTSLMELDASLNITYTESLRAEVSDMLSALDLVILVLIVSAGLLAFVVIYNLNNININERVRELATLKVLGFTDIEVANYIYRENIVLTVLGMAAGCVIGIFLHRFTITTVEVDMTMFGRQIYPVSFLYGALFTIVFSVIVNFAMYFKLKKIDMIESLKSVE